jgi:glycosyltransferase involved in cell wall biosynthesis
VAKVSVIIPNYNHATFLRKRIDSVLSQSYVDFELIILDDASTDNSMAILEEYKNHNKVSGVIYNDTNSGSSFAQWEKGIARSTGDFIWLAESDDYSNPDFLLTCMREFESDAETVLVYTDSFEVDADDNILHKSLDFWYEELRPEKWKSSYRVAGRSEILEALSIKNTIPNASAVVFKKKFYPEIVKLKYCGDWLHWIKLLESNEKVSFVKSSLNYFRSHANTTRHSGYGLEKMRRLLNERSVVLAYLKQKSLVNDDIYQRQRKEIIEQWVNLFRLPDLFGKDFFLPFHNPALFLKFLAIKAKKLIPQKTFIGQKDPN